jgi:membrane-associated phospholipid phosphatase
VLSVCSSEMDFIDIACPVLRAPYFEHLMVVVGYFGHGSVGSVVGLLLLAHGYIYDNPRTKKAGFAVLIALIIAGLAAQFLKEIIQWPRPKNRVSQGFPSGHTSAAFALASVLTVTFPALAPIFYMLAVLTAISRLYFRAHFTWDILGGVVVGLLAGIPVARKLIPRTHVFGRRPLRFVGWLSAAAIGLVGLGFFYSTEKNIGAHMVAPDPAPTPPAIGTFDFGTPEARSLLLYGWSGDEQWFDGKQSVVWASGLASELLMSLPVAQDYRFRLHVFPYSPKGPACQRIEVKVNDTVVSKIFLEQGWHSYEFNVRKSAIKTGKNDIRFSYDYAESPKSHRRSSDERALSVAFDRLDIFPAR